MTFSRIMILSCVTSCLLGGLGRCHAEVIELEGTIKSIDADSMAIAIVRKTQSGEKLLELEIARNVGDISGFREGDEISFVFNPDVEIMTKIAKRVDREKEATPVLLIATNTLDGWEFDAPVDEPTWCVSEGVLICTGEGPDLRTKRMFGNFELSGEFLLPTRGNSGIFFGPKRQYEFALLDSNWRNSRNEMPAADQRCGAIYGKAPPREDAYLGPNEWNRFVLRREGNTVSASLNGRQIHINQRLDGPSSKGTKEQAPLVLQRHGMTIGIKFRNLIISPLPSPEP